MMSVIDYTVRYLIFSSTKVYELLESKPELNHLPDLLSPLRKWLNSLEIRDRDFAHRLCRLIPSQCPFARNIRLFGRTLLVIPPLCKLNPLYEEVIALRFRALCYLADEWGEDISAYC